MDLNDKAPESYLYTALKDLYTFTTDMENIKQIPEKSGQYYLYLGEFDHVRKEARRAINQYESVKLEELRT